MSKLISELIDAINAIQKNKTEPYDRQGEVKRIDGKIAWVQLEGSNLETPVQMTIACDVGDTVQARVGGGSAWLTGNLTAPPTDDKKATQALTMAETVVQKVEEAIEGIEEDIEEVEEAIEEIPSVEGVTIQYCLSSSASTFTQYGDWSDDLPEYVSGKYYWTRTVIEDDEGNVTYGDPQYDQSTQLSVETEIALASTNNHFWHDNTGAYVTTADGSYATGSAVRITSSGILQQVDGQTVSSWTNSGIAFYQGVDYYGSPVSVASFGSGAARIGKTSDVNLQLSTSEIQFYKGSTKFGHIYMDSGVSGSMYLQADTTSPKGKIELGAEVIIGSTGSDLLTVNPTSSKVEIAGDLEAGIIDATTVTATNFDGTTGDITNMTVSTIKGSGDVTIDFKNSIEPYTNKGSDCGKNSKRWDVVYCVSTNTSSDKKAKDSISPIDYANEFIMGLEPIEFQFKDSDHKRYHMGFIAQDVAKVGKDIGKDLSLYSAEYTDGKKYYGEDVDDKKLSWGLTYTEFIPPLVKVVQEQQRRITELERRLA